MIPSEASPPPAHIEAFRLATGASVLSGAFSLLVPALIAASAALAALGFASWVSLASRRRPLFQARTKVRILCSLFAFGLTAVCFVAAPAPVASARGLILALGLVPLLALEHPRRTRQIPTFGPT